MGRDAFASRPRQVSYGPSVSRCASPMKLKVKANTAVRGPSAADGGKWSNRDDYQPGPPHHGLSWRSNSRLVFSQPRYRPEERSW